MKKLKKKTFIVSSMVLMMPITVLFFLSVAYYKYLDSPDMKLRNTAHPEISLNRHLSYIDRDEMIIDNFEKNVLAGNVFGPKGINGKYTLKFNMTLNNLNISYFKEEYWPLFFENKRCFIYAYRDNHEKQIKKERYGLFQVVKPLESYNYELELMTANIYARPDFLWIKVKEVTLSTPIFEIEEICEGIFSFEKF